MDFENIILKNNYTIEDLKKENRIIFFDIDGTLGGNTFHHGILSFPLFMDEKKEQFENFKAKTNINLPFANFISIEPHCLAMFLKTLKDTNSVGFCISSWVSSFKVRNKNSKFSAIDLINQTFKEIFSEWDDSIIVGGIHKHTEDRGLFCENLSEYLNSEYLIIDDSFDDYSIKDYLIPIDADCGFQFKNYRKIISIYKNLTY